MVEMSQCFMGTSCSRLTQAKFGLSNAAVLVLQMNVYPIHELRINLGRQRQPHTQGDVMETSDANVFVIDVGKDRRHSC